MLNTRRHFFLWPSDMAVVTMAEVSSGACIATVCRRVGQQLTLKANTTSIEPGLTLVSSIETGVLNRLTTPSGRYQDTLANNTHQTWIGETVKRTLVEKGNWILSGSWQRREGCGGRGGDRWAVTCPRPGPAQARRDEDGQRGIQTVVLIRSSVVLIFSKTCFRSLTAKYLKRVWLLLW